MITRNDDWPENSYAAIVKRVPSDADSAYLTDSDSEIGTETDDDISLDFAAMHIQDSLNESDEFQSEDSSLDILSDLEKVNTIDQFFERMGVYGQSDPHEDCDQFQNLHKGYWVHDDPTYFSVWDCYCTAHSLICYRDATNDSF